MNPILLGRQTVEGLKDLVRSSFDIASPAFDGMIERFLEEPRNFIQGPWVSIAMPFRSEAEGTQAFAEIPQPFAPYRHQTRAFDRLRGETARSTLVATGTGSGKTECYLLPILDHCRRLKGTPGIKAIIIYPMNALATDQARRIARIVAETPALKGLRCGMYADAEPRPATESMTEHDVITSREAMLRNPPDILLTNYKMLDYLLVRPKDKRLWAENGPETLRYLVVDELHTFDGAQGADLALLVRRLKKRLSMPDGHLVGIGSSATLGKGPEAAAALIDYARTLFGEAFDEDAVITEDRLTAEEVRVGPYPEYDERIDPEAIREALERSMGETQPAAAARLARVVFGDATKRIFGDVADPESPEWRVALGRALLDQGDTHRLIDALDQAGGPLSLDEILETDPFTKGSRYRGWSDDDRRALVEALGALVSWAREGNADTGALRPLLNVRVQVWAREMARMVASLRNREEGGRLSRVDLNHSTDLDADQLRQRLPLVHCSHCGTAGHLALQAPNGCMWADLRTLYAAFFEGHNGVRIIYHEPLRGVGLAQGHGAVFEAELNRETLERTTDTSGISNTEAGPTAPVWIYDPVDARGDVDKTCPACGTIHALQILGLRAQRLSASLMTVLFNSEHHEVDETSKPRVLMFSDSVQDAAQRAAVAEIRNSAAVVRKSLYSFLQNGEERRHTLKSTLDGAPEYYRRDLGEKQFTARFINLDQTWRSPWIGLQERGDPPSDRFVDDIERRLQWEYFSDLTYRSFTGPTLEAQRLIAVTPVDERIALAASELARRLPVHVHESLGLNDEEAYLFLEGILDRMRRRGSVDIDYVRLAVLNNDPSRGPSWFAAQQVLGVIKTNTLPVPNFRRVISPTPTTRRSNLAGFENVNARGPSNWYAHWLDRVFDPKKNLRVISEAPMIFDEVFRTLESQNLVRKIHPDSRPGDYGYLLDPDVVSVTTSPKILSCSRCRRLETITIDAPELPRPCPRIGCDGTMVHRHSEAGEHTGSRFTRSILASPRNHRVIGREHTGILDADDRRALEDRFINDERPWAPNMISATPTLEMGIDIGALSTLVLATVPPEAANYVQRVGRTGRRDGNSLNLTIAAARPHDLQYWEDPHPMLGGEVNVPGVHLAAIEVLKRQATAYALDRYVAEQKDEFDYGRVASALNAIASKDPNHFLIRWFRFLDTGGGVLADEFLAMLPDQVRGLAHLEEGLRTHLATAGEGSLRVFVADRFEEARREKEALQDLQREIDNRIKRLRNLPAPPTDLEEQIQALRDERAEISRVISDRINKISVLQFMTDRGILPNYAFPEEGVRLKSIIAKRTSDGRPVDRSKGEHLKLREYVRPAAAALTELAPDQVFYAEGAQVRVNRVDLEARDLEKWRFCPNCAHSDPHRETDDGNCPRCGSPMWSNVGDGGSVYDVVALRSVIASAPESEVTIRDSDDRDTTRFVRRLFPRYEVGDIEVAYATKGADTNFGYEFLRTCEFRDVNFGREADVGSGRSVAGEPLRAWPFPICRYCGRMQTGRTRRSEQGEHQQSCRALRDELPREEWETRIALLRTFRTEALRIVLPVSGPATDDDIKSFVAAFELGMRKHFSGRIDHLRSETVEERVSGQASVRSLYIYDSVPGGSGFLRQIAEHPKTLRQVFVRARNALRDCPCDSEGKSGCHRCVRVYRSTFGRGEARRDIALRLVEAVLGSWDLLQRESRGIDDPLRSTIVESELERLFLEALDRHPSVRSMQRIITNGLENAYQLAIGKPGETRPWTLRLQVQAEHLHPSLPRKRVDFVFEPTEGGKPIIVELDGWEFHAPNFWTDLADRLAMIRSGKVEVLTFVWSDIDPEKNEAARNPFSRLNDADLARLIDNVRNLAARDVAFERWIEAIDDARWIIGKAEREPLEALMTRLEERHRGTAAESLALVAASVRAVKSLDALDGSERLDAATRDFLEDATDFAVHSSGHLSAFVGRTAQGTHPEKPETFRAVIHADLPAEIDPVRDKAAYSSDWRGVWRLINRLQTLRGLHVYADPSDVSPPSGRSEEEQRKVAAWSEALEFTFGAHRQLAQVLMQAGSLAPDVVGQEIMVKDSVSGMVELGWEGPKVAVVIPGTQLPGWTCFEIDEDHDGPFDTTAADIKAAISGAAPKDNMPETGDN